MGAPHPPTRPRRSTQGDNTGIGVGIVLLVVGLILVLNVIPDIPGIDDVTLGWILVVVGVLAIILALVMNQQRSRTKHVEERRYDGPAR
jgi:uncharacterized membrane protein HdeD (DUF308 family)